MTPSVQKSQNKNQPLIDQQELVHQFISQQTGKMKIGKEALHGVDEKAQAVANYLLILRGADNDVPPSELPKEVREQYLGLLSVFKEILHWPQGGADLKIKALIKRFWPSRNTEQLYKELRNKSYAAYRFAQEIPEVDAASKMKVEIGAAIQNLYQFLESSSQGEEDKENAQTNPQEHRIDLNSSVLLAKLIYATGALIYKQKTYSFGDLIEAWAAASFKRLPLKQSLIDQIGVHKWARKLEAPPEEIQALAESVSFPVFWRRAICYQMAQCLNVQLNSEALSKLEEELSSSPEASLDCAFYFGRGLKFLPKEKQTNQLGTAHSALFKRIEECMKVMGSLQPRESEKNELFNALFLRKNTLLPPFFIRFLEQLLGFSLKQRTKKELEDGISKGSHISDTLFSSGPIDLNQERLGGSALFSVIRKCIQMMNFLNAQNAQGPDFFDWLFSRLIINRVEESQSVADAVVHWLQKRLCIDIALPVQKKIKSMTGEKTALDRFQFDPDSWFDKLIKLYENSVLVLKSSAYASPVLFEWIFLRNPSIKPIQTHSAPSKSGLTEVFDPFPLAEKLGGECNSDEENDPYRFPIFDLIRSNPAQGQLLVSFFFKLKGRFSLRQAYNFFSHNINLSKQDYHDLVKCAENLLKNQYFPLFFLDPPLTINSENIEKLKNGDGIALEFLEKIRPYLGFQEGGSTHEIVDSKYKHWFQNYILNRWDWLFVLMDDVSSWQLGPFDKKILEQAVWLAMDVSARKEEVHLSEASREAAADYIKRYYDLYDLPLDRLMPLYFQRARIKTRGDESRCNSAAIALQTLYRFAPGLGPRVVEFILLHCTPQIWSIFLSSSEISSNNRDKPKGRESDLLIPMNLFGFRKFCSREENTEYYFGPQLNKSIKEKIFFILDLLNSKEFNDEAQVELKAALEASFGPPTQPVKEMCKVFDVTKEHGLICSTPDLVTHVGLLKSAVSQGPVTIYWHWQTVADYPVLTLSIRNIREGYGRIHTLKFPISLEKLKADDLRSDVFGFLDYLGRKFFNGSAPESFDICGKIDKINDEIGEFSLDKASPERQAQLEKVGRFFQDLAFQYRELYLSVLIRRDPPVPFFARVGDLVLNGFMQEKSLLFSNWQAGEPAEPYSLDITDDFFSRCPDLSLPQLEYAELGVALCVRLPEKMNPERIPVYYKVRDLESLRKEQDALLRSALKQPMQEEVEPEPSPQSVRSNKSFSRSRSNTKSLFEDERKESDFVIGPDNHLEARMTQQNEETLFVIFKVDVETNGGRGLQSLTVPMQYKRKLLKKEKDCFSNEEYRRFFAKRKGLVEYQLLMLKYLVYYFYFRPEI